MTSHCELNKDGTNEQAKKGMEKSINHQPYTKNYKHLKKEGNGRAGLPQERAHKLVDHCHTVNTKSIDTSNIM